MFSDAVFDLALAVALTDTRPSLPAEGPTRVTVGEARGDANPSRLASLRSATDRLGFLFGAGELIVLCML